MSTPLSELLGYRHLYYFRVPKGSWGDEDAQQHDCPGPTRRSPVMVGVRPTSIGSNAATRSQLPRDGSRSGSRPYTHGLASSVVNRSTTA